MGNADENFEVRIYGCRGSTPTPYLDRMRFGGNTSCTRVTLGRRVLVFDAGTGIIGLGEEMGRGDCRSLDLFISHAHLDHMQGIPFFQPFFSEEFNIRVWGEARGGLSIREQISASMSVPLWPVNIDTFRANICYKDIEIGQRINLGDGILLETERSRHPNLCTMFKLCYGGKTLIYALDFEHSDESSRHLMDFSKDADLLIYDAQFTDSEYLQKQGWGHSTWQQGVKLAGMSGVKRILFSHHNPQRNDGELLLLERQAKEVFPAASFAREGDVFLL